MRFLMFSHFSDKLIHNKHLAPPSTAMLEQTISTAMAFTGLSPERGILFHDETWHCEGDRMEYALAVTKIGRRYGMKVMQPMERLGYRGALLAVADQVRKEHPEPDTGDHYFWLEHDWEFTRPVDVHAIQKMLARPDCNYVRLPNYHDATERFQTPPHPCHHFSRDCDRRNEVDVFPETIPFMRDSLWSTNPHFGKISKLLEWAEMVHSNPFDNCAGNGFACGIEEVLTHGYFKDIDALGFDEAHKRWGIWLALNGRGFDPLVEHRGV